MLKKFFAVAIVGTIAQLTSGLEIGTTPEKSATTQHQALSQIEADSSDKHFAHMMETTQVDSDSMDRLHLDHDYALTPADDLVTA